jgi:hypothetical protein
MLLLVLLVTYNDPLYPLKDVIPYKLYYVVQSTLESNFVAMMLFFWLFCVHSVASVSFQILTTQQSEQLLNVDHKTFYRPKIVLCFLIWGCMVAEKAYIQIRRLQNPAYFVYENTDPLFMAIEMFEFSMLFLYLVYFMIVTYLVVFVLNMMKKAYKYLTVLTVMVIFTSILIMFLNARTSQLINTPLYVSQYVLYNTYLFLAAFLYAPTLDSVASTRG